MSALRMNSANGSPSGVLIGPTARQLISDAHAIGRQLAQRHDVVGGGRVARHGVGRTTSEHGNNGSGPCRSNHGEFIHCGLSNVLGFWGELSQGVDGTVSRKPLFRQTLKKP
jgi:hypothetical protein